MDVAGDQGRIQTYDPFAVTRVGRQRITPQIWHLLPQRPAKSKTPLTERPSGVSRLVLEQRVDNRFALNAGDRVDTEEQEQLHVADAKEPVPRPDFSGPEAPHADRGRSDRMSAGDSRRAVLLPPMPDPLSPCRPSTCSSRVETYRDRHAVRRLAITASVTLASGGQVAVWEDGRRSY